MHRARRTHPPLPPMSPSTRDWCAPRIRFALVDRDRVELMGEFERHINALVSIVEDQTGKKVDIPDGKIVMPVYDLQVEMMKNVLKGIEVFPKEVSLQAKAQASLRFVHSLPSFSFRSRIDLVMQDLDYPQLPLRPQTAHQSPNLLCAAYDLPLHHQPWAAVLYSDPTSTCRRSFNTSR